MAAVNTLSQIDALLKILYPDELYQEICYKRRVLFGTLPKREDFGAKSMTIPIKYGNPQARSATFSVAKTLAETAVAGEIKAKAFALTRVSDYSLATMNAESIEATAGDNWAFVSTLDDVARGAMLTLASAIEHFLYRSGNGDIGQVASLSGANFTLAEPEEITLFEVGMSLVVAPTSAVTALRSGSALIGKVNRNTGVLTSNAATWATGISAIANDDFIFCEGDAHNDVSKKKISGLESWLPATAPSASESHFGVDRTADSRLYGIYHNGAADASIEAALIRGQAKVGREEGNARLAIMHTTQFRKLVEEMGAKREYSDVNARGVQGLMANVGYRGITVHGDAGEMVAVSSNKCQAEICWALTPQSAVLATLGSPVKWAMADGLRMLRLSDDDGYQGRLVFRGNLAFNAPVWNAHIALPAI